MATATQDDQWERLGEGGLTRPAGRKLNTPRQERSAASLERMLAATKALMLRHGNADFTLINVSRTGKVAVGSIYLRFKAKEDLIRAVLARGLDDICLTEERLIADQLAESRDLGTFLRAYVEGFADMLQTNAPILRLGMERADFDEFFTQRYASRGSSAEGKVVGAMLSFRHEICGSRPRTKSDTCSQIIFSAIVRELGLASAEKASPPQDWSEFKQEIAAACLAYLKHAP